MFGRYPSTALSATGLVTKEQVVPHIVVNAERHFLEHHIGRAGGKLEARTQRQRSQRAVRCHSDIISLRHCRDTPAFAQTPGMA